MRTQMFVVRGVAMVFSATPSSYSNKHTCNCKCVNCHIWLNESAYIKKNAIIIVCQPHLHVYINKNLKGFPAMATM